MSVDFCLLDSRVADTALVQSRHRADQIGQPKAYVEPKGVHLQLFGRSVDGRSVVVETQLDGGLTLSLLDEHDSAMPDGLYAESVKEELMQRACALQPELADVDDLSVDIVRKPCFYGFEPDPSDPLTPRTRRLVELTTQSLRLYRALRRAAEHALHDEPLDCGARPCELSALPHAVAMEALGLHHGKWVRATGQSTAAAAADVTLACASTGLAPLPELDATLPPLVLASYDIECSSGAPDAAGNYAFPDAFKPDHAVRCVAVVATSLRTAADAAATHRFFLHTGPRALTAEHHCATAAADEGASEAAVNLEVRHFATEADLLQGFAALLRDEIRPDVLYSYNGTAFDAPFLAQRIEQVLPAAPPSADFEDRAAARGHRRAAHGWGRTPMDALPPKTLGMPKTEEQIAEIQRKRAEGKVIYEPKAFDAPGMAHHDVLDFGQSLGLETSKLADVSAEVLGGTTKTDLAIADMMDILRTSDADGWARVAVYNVRDAELPLRIMLAKDQVAFSLLIAAVSGCTLPQVCAGGQQKRLQSMVQREVRARGLLFNEPSKLDFVARPWLCGGGEKVKGATVLDIQPGWYRDPVVTCDYSSLYPSIVISRNLCPSKLLLDAVKPTLPAGTPPALAAAVRTFRVEERDADLVHHHHVIQRAPDGSGVGVFPAISERVLAERRAAKRELKQHVPGSPAHAILDAKQQALKVICNSLYGALNAVLKGSLYCRPLGGIVTAEGRAAIASIQADVARLPGAEVVAGDTDSVMFRLDGKTLEEAQAIGTAVAASVTTKLRADGAHAVELAYEKTMLPSVFVAKKAYAYVCHAPGKPPAHVSMGLMSKKRGTAALFKDAFVDCERAYLLDPASFSADDVRRVQLRVLRDLEESLATASPEAFAKTTMLKPEAAYAPGYNAPHVNAARRLVAAMGCAWPGNARFKYVQAQPATPVAKSKRKASDHSMELGFFVRSKTAIDTAHYVASVHNRFEALLRFTLPDAPARFGQLMTTLERRPANTKSINSHPWFRNAVPAAPPPPPLTAASERAYLADPHAEGARAAETAFWRAALSDASPPKHSSGPFSDVWRAPQPLTSACAVRRSRLPAQAAPTAVLFGSGKRTKVDETEARASAVAAKQQKLAENSATISAQPRRGAVNQVPAFKSKAAKAHNRDIASFFVRVQ